MKTLRSPLAGLLRPLLVCATALLTLTATTSAQTGTVNITYDDHGVPHIDGTTDRATYFGLGYAQARDRYFQMCLLRLAGQGRMSEYFGKDAEGAVDAYLKSDKLSRIVGYQRHCSRLASDMLLSHATEFGLMQAYADGVNRFRDDAIAAGTGFDPLFATHGVPKTTWTVADSILVWMVEMQPFHQSFVSDAQLLGLASGAVGPDAKLESMFRDRLVVDRTATVRSASEYDSAELAAALNYQQSKQMFHDVRGTSSVNGVYVPHFSNAIAVAGDKVSDPTGSPEAFLVGMPRIPASAPGPLYEWYVRSTESSATSSGFEGRGAGIAGSPNMLIGSNGGNGDANFVSVGWSMTSASQDISDLMELEIAVGSNGSKYIYDAAQKPFVTSTEVIKVRNGSIYTTVTVNYRESIWGPVVTELVNDILPGNTKEYALAHMPFFLAPTSNTSQVRPPNPFVATNGMLRASGLVAFQDVVRSSYSYPAAHMTMADGDGNIGYTATGALPVRRPVLTGTPAADTHRFAGILPLMGNSSSNMWQEFVEPAYRARVIHAQGTHRGYLHNGNQAGVGSWHPLKALYAGGGDTSERGLTLRRIMDVTLASPSGKISRDALRSLPANRGRLTAVLLADLLSYISASGGTLSPDSVTFTSRIYTWLSNGGELNGITNGAVIAALFSATKPQLGSANTVSTGNPQLDSALANLAAIYGGRASGGLNFLEEMHRGIRGVPAPHPYANWTLDEQLVLEAWAASAIAAFKNLDGNPTGPEYLDIRSYYFSKVYRLAAAAEVPRWQILGLPGRLPTTGVTKFQFAQDPLSTLGDVLSHTTGASYNSFLSLDGNAAQDRWSVLSIGQAEQINRAEYSSQATLLATGDYKHSPVTPLVASAPNQPTFAFTVP